MLSFFKGQTQVVDFAVQQKVIAPYEEFKSMFNYSPSISQNKHIGVRLLTIICCTILIPFASVLFLIYFMFLYECSLLLDLYFIKMSWINMDASIGFNFNSYDSNSNAFLKVCEDSYSQPDRLFQENFSDMYEHSNHLSFFPQMKLEFVQDNSNHSHKVRHQEEYIPQSIEHKGGSHRGLKSLAQLLVKVLYNRSLMQKDIVYLIEDILCKGKRYKLKEQKNIKRRIYDALIVMIASGILQKNQSQITLKGANPQQNSDDDPISLQQIEVRLEKKRELLSKLISKKEALQFWMCKNRLSKSSQQILNFPLIFVVNNSPDFWIDSLKEVILMKGQQLQLFSETDMIEEIYCLQSKDCGVSI